MDASEVSVATDPSLGLFVFPNATGWRMTEFRMWAAARPQHEIDAVKDWTLKLAKTRGGKKRGGGLFQGVTIKAASKSVAAKSGDGQGTSKVQNPGLGLAPPKKLSALGGPAPSGRRRRKKHVKDNKHVFFSFCFPLSLRSFSSFFVVFS